MGAHINDNGEFQSDKYPTCPPGKVPLSVHDRTAQDLLWEYAERRRAVDEEFSDDLARALGVAGFEPPDWFAQIEAVRSALREAIELHVARVGTDVPVLSLPDELVADAFMTSLLERGHVVRREGKAK